MQRLLEPAFDLMGDRHYCLMSVPHTARRMSLLSLFLPVKQRLGRNFSHALYVCHKASLISPLYVTPATEEDREDLRVFLEDEVPPSLPLLAPPSPHLPLPLLSPFLSLPLSL